LVKSPENCQIALWLGALVQIAKERFWGVKKWEGKRL